MIRYFEKQLEELDYSIHSLDETIFSRWVEEAAATLKNNKKIIVSGLGKNVPICEKFVGSMVSLGLDACFLHTNSAVHGDMGIVKSGDMVILLTKSGETEESVDLHHEGDLWNIMPNNSTTINLIILQGLAMLTAKKLELDIGQFRRNHPGGQIGKKLEYDKNQNGKP